MDKLNISSLIKNLYISIINYEMVYKSIQEKYFNKKKDNDLYLKDYKYQRNRLKS